MAKVLPRENDRREEPRRRLQQVFPMNVLREDDGQSITCQLQDLSAEGLCVLVKAPLPPGTRLRFVTLKREFLLEVVWCEKSADSQLHCGLALQDEKDMQILFAGFLADQTV